MPLPDLSLLHPEEFQVGVYANPANVMAEFQQLITRSNAVKDLAEAADTLSQANSGLIETLDGRVDTIDDTTIPGVVSTVNTNIANIAANAADIAANAADIATNTADIATNASGISTNASAISSLETDVTAAEGDIDDLEDGTTPIPLKLTTLGATTKTLDDTELSTGGPSGGTLAGYAVNGAATINAANNISSHEGRTIWIYIGPNGSVQFDTSTDGRWWVTYGGTRDLTIAGPGLVTLTAASVGGAWLWAIASTDNNYQRTHYQSVTLVTGGEGSWDQERAQEIVRVVIGTSSPCYLRLPDLHEGLIGRRYTFVIAETGAAPTSPFSLYAYDSNDAVGEAGAATLAVNSNTAITVEAMPAKYFAGPVSKFWWRIIDST